MKKFSFPLETLLRYKQLLQDKAAEEFNDSRAELVKMIDELIALRGEEDRLRQELKKAQKGTIDIGSLVLHLRYLSHVSHTADAKAGETAEREQETERLRQDLLKVLRDKNVVEHLKEKKFEEFLREVADQEQKSADENAISRFNRRKEHAK